MSCKKSALFLIVLIMVFFASIVSAQTFVSESLVASEQPVITSIFKYNPNLVLGGNRWIITGYNDRSPFHSRMGQQGICFRYVDMVGTHMSYEWYSDTFPNWNGKATQEGDQIVMHGDYYWNIGHDGMIWDIVTDSYKNEGAGHWWEWRENSGTGNTIGFANAKLRRAGYCLCTEKEAELLPLPVDATGKAMDSPMGME